jgi:hypothetical protein
MGMNNGDFDRPQHQFLQRRLLSSNEAVQEEEEKEEMNEEEESGEERGETLYFCHPCGISFYHPSGMGGGRSNGPTVEVLTNDDDVLISSSQEGKQQPQQEVEGKQQQEERKEKRESKVERDVREEQKEGDQPSSVLGGLSVSGVGATTSSTTSSTTPERRRTSSSLAPTPGGSESVLSSGRNSSSSIAEISEVVDPSILCPHCGDNFVELARMPRPRRRRRLARLQRRRDERRQEAMHIQALLSALRASIVNQLEEAEVQMAMRQSMENYKPHMLPACKMSIGNLVDCEVLEGVGADHKQSSTGVTTTMDQLSDASCPICAEDFQVGDKVAARLPMCQHSFHSACVKKWFDVNNTCPICRSILPAQCQACIDNQAHEKDLKEQAETARRRSSSNQATRDEEEEDNDEDNEDESRGAASGGTAASGAAGGGEHAVESLNGVD